MYPYLAWNLPLVDVWQASCDLAMILLLLCVSWVTIICRLSSAIECMPKNDALLQT